MHADRDSSLGMRDGWHQLTYLCHHFGGEWRCRVDQFAYELGQAGLLFGCHDALVVWCRACERLVAPNALTSGAASTGGSPGLHMCRSYSPARFAGFVSPVVRLGWRGLPVVEVMALVIAEDAFGRWTSL
jgi:hypothetical protein